MTGAASPRWAARATWVIPALVAYVPLLLTAPGVVGADTKTYLYLDPGRLLSGAPSLWDPEVGLGTVSHQNIGYLFPMGPFYWLAEQLGSPDWVAQRLWLGTVLLAAGLGVRRLVRDLVEVPEQWRHGGVLTASLAYMLSPYLLDYSARISVLLLPWAALPWFVVFARRAVLEGGWRAPAWFALAVLASGGINATALIMVAFGPALWFVYAWRWDGARLGQVWAALWRCGALTLLTSLWWMAGLWAQGRYGLPVLRYTESYKTVAEASSSIEVLRGLGYWFFYGEDKLGPWIEPSSTYTTVPASLALSYALPVAAFAVAAVLRWRHRAYFVLLAVVGALASIAAHPWTEPSPAGALFKAFTRTDAGLALRSTPRAVPLVALATAVFLGAGVSVVARRLPRARVAPALLATLAVAANLPTLWNGEMVAANLQRPEDLPAYWLDAIAELDAAGTSTRILELPGADFASYRWGNTVDPVTPGLTDRPYVARELFQYGTAPSSNLLIALDRGLHDRTLDPDAVATLARLLGVGDVVLRSDLQYERYRLARPRPTWALLLAAPGLADPRTFGDAVPNRAGPEQPMLDEIELGTAADAAWPPPVAIFGVGDPEPIVRAVSAERPLLLAGDGDGLVAAAGAGLVEVDRAVVYAASAVIDDELWARTYDAGADLLVTDSNRRQARRWGGLRENTGYTEQEGEEPLTFDPTDNRLELFPGATSASSTVTEQRGGAAATATDYGNPVTYTPDDRAANAVDGDPSSAWRVGALESAIGERLVLDLPGPVTTDRLHLLQPTTLVRNRWITRVAVHLDDGGPPIQLDLGLPSRTLPGQTLTFAERTFSHAEIEVLATSSGIRPRYDGQSAVGFAEVRIPGVAPTLEVVRTPTDLLDRAGASSIDHRLVALFTRQRTDAGEPVRADEEARLVRSVALPTARTFGVWGEVRLSAAAPAAVIDALVGAVGGPRVTAESTLAGALDHRPAAALDGDLTTHHTFSFDDQQGRWLEVDAGRPVTLDRLDLAVVADGRHSVPSSVRIEADGATVAVVDLPAVADRDEADGTVAVPVVLPRATTGTTWRVTVEAANERRTVDWYSEEEIVLPVAVAELGLGDLVVDAPAARVDTGCRDDLVAVDGRPVAVRITGDTADALARQPLQLTACGDAASGVAVDDGELLLTTAPGRITGLDIDRLVLASERGGGSLAAGDVDLPDATAPDVSVTGSTRTSFELDVAEGGATEPYWLVLGQSLSPGWEADVAGVAGVAGPGVLVNGYANGWYVDPSGDPVTTRRITLTWTPQRVVTVALAASALGVLVCAAIVLATRRRRRADPGAGGVDDLPGRPTSPTVGGSVPAPWGWPPTLALAALAAVLAVLAAPFGATSAPVAVAVGAGTTVALRFPRRARWVAGLGVALVAAAAGYVVVQQVRFGFPADFVWPQQFDLAHPLGVVAVLLLATSAVTELLAGGRPAGSGEASSGEASSGPNQPTGTISRPVDGPAPASYPVEDPA